VFEEFLAQAHFVGVCVRVMRGEGTTVDGVARDGRGSSSVENRMSNGVVDGALRKGEKHGNS